MFREEVEKHLQSELWSLDYETNLVNLHSMNLNREQQEGYHARYPFTHRLVFQLALMLDSLRSFLRGAVKKKTANAIVLTM